MSTPPSPYPGYPQAPGPYQQPGAYPQQPGPYQQAPGPYAQAPGAYQQPAPAPYQPAPAPGGYGQPQAPYQQGPVDYGQQAAYQQAPAGPGCDVCGAEAGHAGDDPWPPGLPDRDAEPVAEGHLLPDLRARRVPQDAVGHDGAGLVGPDVGDHHAHHAADQPLRPVQDPQDPPPMAAMGPGLDPGKPVLRRPAGMFGLLPLSGFVLVFLFVLVAIATG
ncbi:hypothetical protein ACQ4WX_23040 [Streptomyces lasalocidi]